MLIIKNSTIKFVFILCKIQTTLTMEGDKLVVVQKDSKTGKHQTTVYKEVVDGKLIEVCYFLYFFYV